jgi:ubiquinone/menaquinone biosynthesis C-methylase UbiE
VDKTIDIKRFWDDQATSHGDSYLATMPDKYLKDLEMENISKYLNDGMQVADIGCGNGYSTFKYASVQNIQIDAIDYSEAMIQTARETLSRSHGDLQDRVAFSVGDVRNTKRPSETFDAVITDRCLINLASRQDQEKALQEVHRILKKGGLYLMCEDTEQGQNTLNRVRALVNLPPIPIRWHNLYLDETHIRSAAKNLFELKKEVRFSSFYYLASRVLNAKIAQEQGAEPRYDSDMNRVAAMCSSLGEFGDCGPLKLFVFRKT